MTSNHSIALCALAAIAFSSCQKENKQIVTEDEDLPKVETNVVVARLVPQTNEYTATVEAENINNIAPSSPNRIKTIAVEVGDHVKKGQTLVTLDRSASDQLKINLDQVEREYQRALKLLEIGSGTQQNVDQLKSQLDAARSQYDNLLENTILTSPITGVVTQRNYDPGDMTGNLPVLTVGQLSPSVKVIINVTENDLSKISAGMPVSIAFDALPDQTFEGRISRIYPTIDTSSRTFKTEIIMPNPKEQIIPGMFARVTINLGDRNNVVVPDRAIVKQPGSGNKYVYILHGDTVNYERVELGRRLDDAYELISGVNSGDTVIISGQSRLIDGSKVEVINN